MNRPAGQSDFELDRLKELLLRPETDRLAAVAIDRDMRAKEKPSDHVPIRAEFRE